MNLSRLLSFFFLFSLFLSPLTAFATTSNDPLYEQQWYLDRIGIRGAWETETGSPEIIVAIIDAGIDIHHEDLAGNIWQNSNEIAGNGKDDDHNGYIDDINGWDFIENDPNVEPSLLAEGDIDAISHGSLVAGMIGAVGNNSTGVSGVNWDISLMPLRTLNEYGSGNSIDVSNAIRYAVDNGASVINLSFSGTDRDDRLGSALEYAYEEGVVVVSAMGNNGLDVARTPVYPACYTGEGEDWVIGVAATGKTDEQTDFTNYGSDCVDISAPGVDIFGVSFYDPSYGFNDKYDGGWFGTSMSAPLVSGVAGLLKASNTDLTPQQIKIALQLSVDPLPRVSERPDMGAGRLNAAQALVISEQLYGTNPAEDKVVVVEDIPTTSLPKEAVEEVENLNQEVPLRFIKTPSSPTVFAVTESGSLRVVVDEFTFFTYERSFSVLEIVPEEVINQMPLEGLLLPKPGVVLVKRPANSGVFALEYSDEAYQYKVRWIPSEEIATSLFGPNWSEYVIVVNDHFWAQFTEGTWMQLGEFIDRNIMKTRNQLR